MSDIAPPPQLPASTPESFSAALRAFLDTMIAVTARRGRDLGQHWVVESAGSLRSAVEELSASPTWDGLLPEDDDPATSAAFAVLETEMLYIAFRYRDLLPDASRETVEAAAGRFDGVQRGDPSTPDAVDDIETVKGSIEKQIKKLPKWLQRVLEVLMEILKLTKGMIH